jgi:hypothetical protein
MEVVVNPKVARFFPLAIPAIIILRELYRIIFWYGFDIVYYLNRDRYMHGILGLIIFVMTSAIKVVIGLGALYLAKSYSEAKVRNTKLIAGGLLGIYIFGGLVGRIAPSYDSNAFSAILGLLLFIVIVANLVISLIITDPSAPAKTPRAPKPMPAPVAFNPPAQNYASPAGQSVPDQLSALEKLHASGALTDAEFKAAKKKILE